MNTIFSTLWGLALIKTQMFDGGRPDAMVGLVVSGLLVLAVRRL